MPDPSPYSELRTPIEKVLYEWANLTRGRDDISDAAFAALDGLVGQNETLQRQADANRKRADVNWSRAEEAVEQLETFERALRDILSGGWEGPNELSRAGWIAKLALQGEYPVEPGSSNEAFVSNPATGRHET